MSKGEELVDAWLQQHDIPFRPQFRFHPVRRWRFDFAIGFDGAGISKIKGHPSVMIAKIAVEVEGGQFTGGHKRGRKADTDLEKFNAATLLDWRVLRFSTGMVERGEAWPVIQLAWADALGAVQVLDWVSPGGSE